MSDAVREMFAPGPIPDHVLEGDSYAALVRCDEEYVAALRAGTGLPDWFYDPAGRPADPRTGRGRGRRRRGAAGRDAGGGRRRPDPPRPHHAVQPGMTTTRFHVRHSCGHLQHHRRPWSVPKDRHLADVARMSKVPCGNCRRAVKPPAPR